MGDTTIPADRANPFRQVISDEAFEAGLRNRCRNDPANPSQPLASIDRMAFMRLPENSPLFVWHQTNLGNYGRVVLSGRQGP